MSVQQEYDESVSRKVRKTLTLDPDLVEALGDDPAALSATVNEILRHEIERREMRAALGRFLGELENEHGTPDPEKVEYFRQLLTS